MSFKTHPISLHELLKRCERGDIQLPDFQRSWVWDDDRMRKLIASVSQGFPVGAVLTLDTGGEVNFSPRVIQGAEATAKECPSTLLLDGQQRLTSLFQVAMRQDGVAKDDDRKKARYWYIDILKALDPSIPRKEAIFGVDETRRITRNFGKEVILDLSTREQEFLELKFPLVRIFDWYEWAYALTSFYAARGEPEKHQLFDRFRQEVIARFSEYQLPVIMLDKATTREAVCLVFENVNTGGKGLDAFELVTAIYAAGGFKLRDDWAERRAKLRKARVLHEIASTEFLQAIALLHSAAERRAAAKPGEAITVAAPTRPALLQLPLDAYKRYADAVEAAYLRAAKFLHGLGIYRAYDLPYQSQLVPLAAIIATLGETFDLAEARRKIAEWYWCGVFGEKYGSTTESRFARDVVEVPAWIAGGNPPTTVQEATFQESRLHTMRMRTSAAYKGANALLLRRGARDFRSGQHYDLTAFFDESVDIHHVFPRGWCEKNKIPRTRFDSIVNKTPLSAKTNRMIGGVAPSAYLARLENAAGGNAIAPGALDAHLESHLIAPAFLRADDFDGFMKARREALLAAIEEAMGKAAVRDLAILPSQDDGLDETEEGDEADDVEISDASPAQAAE